MNIHRREFLKAAALSALALPLINSTSFAMSDKQARPNILLLITDQHHHNAFSSLGNKNVSTPNFDTIIQNGVAFSNAYSTNPVCIPARSTMFTGRMPTETGHWFNSARAGQMEPGVPTLGKWLSEKAGYESVYAGKWHVPGCHDFDIEGFNVLSAGQYHWGDVSDEMAARACSNYIYNRSSNSSKKQSPFFMVCSLIQPHDICMWLSINTNNKTEFRYDQVVDQLPDLPDNFEYDPIEPEAIVKLRDSQQPNDGSWEKKHWQYYLWNYYRHVEMVDAEFGRVLSALKATGQLDNTIIIHTSDHGEGLGEHQMVRKGYLYDASIKIPMIFYGPAYFDKGKTDSNLASLIDLFPTACDFAAAPHPAKQMGVSLMPLLQGKKKSLERPLGDFVVAEYGGKGKSLSATARMVRGPKYKYVRYYADDVEQLFDMVNDPGQINNLAKNAESKPIIDEHKAMLVKWEKNLELAPRVIKAKGEKWQTI